MRANKKNKNIVHIEFVPNLMRYLPAPPFVVVDNYKQYKTKLRVDLNKFMQIYSPKLISNILELRFGEFL